MEYIYKYYKRYSEKRYDIDFFSSLTPLKNDLLKYKGYIVKNNSEISQKLFDLGNMTLKLNKLEIFSKYHMHNLTPSVRNYHSTFYIMVVNKKIYIYDFFEDEIIFLDYFHGKVDCDSTYIIGMSDIFNLIKYYGEFSLYLSLLESGHLLANIKNFCDYQRLDYEQVYLPKMKDQLKEMNIITETLYSPFTIKIKNLTGSLSISNEYIEKNHYINEYFDELKSTYYLKNILQSLNRGDIYKVNKSYKSRKHFFYDFRYRNSANNLVGNYNLNLHIKNKDIEMIMEKIRHYLYNLTSDDMNFCIFHKNCIYHDDGRIENNNINYGKVMYNDHTYFDLSSYNNVIIIYTKDCNLEGGNVFDHLLSIGELMQGIALISSDCNYSMRPMKNHNDSYIKKILDFKDKNDVEINYIGVICERNSFEI